MGRGLIMVGPVGFGFQNLPRALRGFLAISDVIRYAFLPDLILCENGVEMWRD